jgi:S-formylglutathione hydrolase FrmB
VVVANNFRAARTTLNFFFPFRVFSFAMRTNVRRLLLCLSLVVSLQLAAQTAAPAQHLHFKVTIAPEVSSKPVSGRLLVLMTSKPVKGPSIRPQFGEDAHDIWIAAEEVTNIAPGSSVDIDPDEIAYPAPLSKAPSGDYSVMAYLDVNHHAAYRFGNAGDMGSKIVEAKQLDPASSAPVELTITEVVPDRPVKAPEGAELLDFTSPSLSAFFGRPIHMRGIVILPPTYAKSTARFPTVYMTPGYGANMQTLAGPYANMLLGKLKAGAPEMIWVLLDQSGPYGTHEFADSVNNGPWGKALTTELIPHLEKKYRMDAKPSGRFLTGHSSGGWATMWLQVTYPKVFGGTWSTSPDPVDFRDFTGIDLTKSGANAYKRPDGTLIPLVRMKGKDVQSIEDYAHQEAVLGDYGGQFRSFEAVFSPRADDLTPMKMFNRATGDVDPDVAKAWERYDISRILRDNWKTLAPDLRGKIHIVVGTADTFHLDGPVRLLDAELKKLNADAHIRYLEGRSHFDLYEGGLEDQITNEMYAVARPGKKKPAPASAPAKAAKQASGK